MPNENFIMIWLGIAFAESVIQIDLLGFIFTFGWPKIFDPVKEAKEILNNQITTNN